jgi:hypothetical protein
MIRRREMKKSLIATFVLVLVAAQMVFAHDPRTVAKNLTHSLDIEGTGKLTINYKSLHYNEQGFAARKERLVPYNRLWKAIGKLTADFDVVIGGVAVPKGSYTLGFNFDANDNFKLVLSGGASDINIPMKTAMDGPAVNFMSIDLRPENGAELFTLEARYGTLRTSAEVKVPALADHSHDQKGDHKPAEKKP